MRNLLILQLFVFISFIQVGRSQEQLLTEIFESIRNDDPTRFFNLFTLSEKQFESIYGHELNKGYDDELKQYRKDRHVAFYEFIKRIDDHRVISIDSVSARQINQYMKYNKVYFKSQNQNCTAEIQTVEYRSNWLIAKLETKVKCKEN